MDLDQESEAQCLMTHRKEPMTPTPPRQLVNADGQVIDGHAFADWIAEYPKGQLGLELTDPTHRPGQLRLERFPADNRDVPAVDGRHRAAPFDEPPHLGFLRRVID